MAAPDRIILTDSHEPSIKAGTYDLSIRQKLQRKNAGQLQDLAAAEYEAAARFHVRGPRITLQPAWIDARFPPRSSAGDHAGVLPHLSLTRSTLPWERDALHTPDQQNRHPWLTLLVLNEEEFGAATDHQQTVADLRAPSTSPAFPGLGVEKGPADGDLVRVIDVDLGVLRPLLPTANSLVTLTHVRERFIGHLPEWANEHLRAGEVSGRLHLMLHDLGCPLSVHTAIVEENAGSHWRLTDPDSRRIVEVQRNPTADTTSRFDVVDQARAVVLSSRFLRPGGAYRAFLVSVEGRYGADGDFDTGGARADSHKVRLPVLDSWDFSVDATSGHLHQILEDLFPGGSSSANLTLPSDHLSAQPRALLKSGYVPLTHRTRQGGVRKSWYRGPLIGSDPSRIGSSPTLPAQTSDALLFFGSQHGMLYTHHASAWELGRQLMLADTKASIDLQDWKTEHRHWDHRSSPDRQAYPGRVNPDRPSHSLPDSVRSLIQRLVVLQGVPFGYLVADPNMLPAESARFFVVDRHWTDCLIDGAFSAGRSLGRDALDDTNRWDEFRREAYAKVDSNPMEETMLTGMLIRSELVEGWPNIHIEARPSLDGESASGTMPPRLLRRARLSDNVLFMLFAGPPQTLEFHPNQEALHHGVDYEDHDMNEDGTISWSGRLRNADGVAEGNRSTVVTNNRDVLDVAAAAGSASPEEFALRFIAGPPKLTVNVAWAQQGPQGEVV